MFVTPHVNLAMPPSDTVVLLRKQKCILFNSNSKDSPTHLGPWWMNCAVGKYALSPRVVTWANKSSVTATWPLLFSIKLLTTWIMFCRIYLHILCSAISHRLSSRLRSRNDCVELSHRTDDVRQFLCFPSSQNVLPCEAQWIPEVMQLSISRQDSTCYIFPIGFSEFSLLVKCFLHHVTKMHLAEFRI